MIKLFLVLLLFLVSLPVFASGGDGTADDSGESETPQDNYFCVLEFVKKSSREYIQTAYGMGNIGSMNLSELCQDFYSRDIATQSNDLVLINSWGDVSENPDQFWLDHNLRRPLSTSELEQYKCFFQDDSFLTVLGSGAINLMPETPDSFRVPALFLNALDEYNSPILRFLAVQAYSTVLPILSIAAIVKTWKLVKK